MEESTKMIEYEYHWDAKNNCFKTPDKGISFKDLYNSKNKISFTKSSTEYILYNGVYYPFIGQGEIKIIFVDGKEITVYFPRNLLIFDFIKKYSTYQYIVKKEGSQSFVKEEINAEDKYTEIKFISLCVDKEEYNKLNQLILLDDNKRSLSELTAAFNIYYENTIIKDLKPTFKLTKERNEFFEYLQKELKYKNLISFCGPKGIGKTISIIAFFRNYKEKYNYFYCNINKLFKYYSENNMIKAKYLMLKELYNCVELDELNNNLIKFEGIFEKEDHPINLILKIIELFNLNYNIVLILDQYKIKYDVNYEKLQILLDQTSKNKIKVIIISSMNEFDVKESIVKILDGKVKKQKFFLDYIYISSLVLCDPEDINLLNEEERNLLQIYGSTYHIFYEIQKHKKLYNDNSEKNSSFSEYFNNEMKKNFENRINDYFNNENQDKDMASKYEYLINKHESFISINEFILYSTYIPFRFIKFNYKNQNIFKISDIKKEDKLLLNFQSDQYLYYLASMHSNLVLKTQENSSPNSSDSNQHAINLEKLFLNYLWTSKEIEFIDDIKIVGRTKIYNFFKINKETFNFDTLKNGDSILIELSQQNAPLFNVGVLKCIDKTSQKFYLYLFQVTKEKNSNERMSYITLNDNLNYIKIYFSITLGIIIKEIYFAYIFDAEKPDNASIKCCVNNNINYAEFNLRFFKVFRKQKILPYRSRMKIFDYLSDIYKGNINILFTEITKSLNGDLNDSKNFLKKKKKLSTEIDKRLSKTKNKELKNTEKDNKKDNKMNKSKKKGNINTNDNNKKSEIINIEEDDQDEDKSHENNKNNEDKITNEEEVEISNIIEHINSATKYYKKIFEPITKKAYEINSIQIEKIIEDYLLINSKNDIPGISYKIENQREFLIMLREILSENETKNLLKLILKDKNDFILQIKKLETPFIPIAFVPEFKTYVFEKLGDKVYYIDYLNKEWVDINDNKTIPFMNFDLGGIYYAISCIRQNKENEWENILKNINDFQPKKKK